MGLLGAAVRLRSNRKHLGAGGVLVALSPALRGSPEGAGVGAPVGAKPLPQLQLGFAGESRPASQGLTWAAAPLGASLLGRGRPAYGQAGCADCKQHEQAQHHHDRQAWVMGLGEQWGHGERRGEGGGEKGRERGGEWGREGGGEVIGLGEGEDCGDVESWITGVHLHICLV